MKTPFPLFVRLLLWFFGNLLFLVLGLLLMIRLQFGSLDNWLIPASSQAKIQNMMGPLFAHLVRSDRSEWTGLLAQAGADHQMEFALYDFHGQWVAGAPLQPPGESRQAMTFRLRPGQFRPPPPFQSQPQSPSDPPSSSQPFPPPPPDSGGPPPSPGGPPSDSPSPVSPEEPAPGGSMPDFSKNALHTTGPTAYWLMIRLPGDVFHSPGPFTLLGYTPALGATPLLFNPKPWVALLAGIILLSALFWIPLARNLTRSITRMTQATEQIAAGRFDIHLAETRQDELGRLGHAINRMSAQLKGFVTGQRRFLGDAAHELCSPLARMEVALGILEERCQDDTLDYIRGVRDEVTLMRKLANELLSFSKAALGESHLKLETLPVAALVDAALRLERSDSGQIELDLPEELHLRGDFELLRRALANLIRNALRYAGADGPITVSARAVGAEIILTVADCGPGVPPRELEKLFEPFYRVDSARTSETGGVGLGLAIVKSAVEACSGTVTARNRHPQGLQIDLHLHRGEA